MSSKVTVQILGSHQFEVNPTIIFRMDTGVSVMFGCGSGVQRAILEKNVKISKLSEIFLPNLCPHTIGGLPGVLLTIEDPEAVGDDGVIPWKPRFSQTEGGVTVEAWRRGDIHLKGLKIWGPRGLMRYMRALTRNVAAYRKLYLEIYEISFSDDGSKVSFPISIITGQSRGPCIVEMKVQILPPVSRDTMHRNKRRRATESSDYGCCCKFADSICFLLQLPKVYGKFDPKKAAKKSIPPGPLFAKLKSGASVTLKDGSVIHSSEVCAEPEAGKVVLVTCGPLPAPGRLESMGSGDASAEEAAMPERLPFAAMISGTSDLEFLLGPREGESSISKETVICYNQFQNSFAASRRFIEFLRRFLPSLFPELSPLPDASPPDVFEFLGAADIAVRRLPDTGEDSVASRASPCMDDAVESCKEEANKIAGDISNSSAGGNAKSRPRLLFLGTGAAVPSRYRNVSGCLLTMSDEESVLLECGEGSLSQLRMFSETSDDFCRRLLSIRSIFISHAHADHYLGLMPLLLARKTLKIEQSPGECEPVKVMGPARVGRFLAEAATPCGEADFEFCEIEENRKIENGKLTFDFCGVDHISKGDSYDSFGVRISGMGMKLCFSGDCRPSVGFIALAEGSDVLIHEATFEDVMLEEAVQKRHSTLGEAIDVARKAGCRRLVLTHFSQRYPGAPVLSEAEGGKETEGDESPPSYMTPCYAFDGMNIDLASVDRIGFLFHRHALPLVRSLRSDEG